MKCQHDIFSETWFRCLKVKWTKPEYKEKMIINIKLFYYFAYSSSESLFRLYVLFCGLFDVMLCVILPQSVWTEYILLLSRGNSSLLGAATGTFFVVFGIIRLFLFLNSEGGVQVTSSVWVFQ